MTYRVQVGYGPGDWDVHSEHATRLAAVEVMNDLPPIHIGRYPFPLPVRVVKVVTRPVPVRAADAYASVVARLSGPSLRKAA